MKIYEAMGAKAVDKHDPKRQLKIDTMFKDPNYIGQRKLDGERILVHKHEDGIVQIFGRGSSKYGGRMEKTLLLPHIVEEIRNSIPNGTVLDGEVLYIDNKLTLNNLKVLDFRENFWKCREIMGSHPEKALVQQEREGNLFFFVFDILSYNGTDLSNQPYKARLIDLGICFKFIDSFHIRCLPIVYGEDGKRKLLEACLELGLEGIILKNLNAKYHEGKKPVGQWVKIKQEQEVDCVIMGYSPANQFTELQRDGKKLLDDDDQPVLAVSKYYTNKWIGAIWVGQYIPVNRVNTEHLLKFREIKDSNYPHLWKKIIKIEEEEYCLVPVAKISGMDEATREKVTNSMVDFLGTVIKVNYFDQTADSYFQPRINCFREDKPQNECIWE